MEPVRVIQGRCLTDADIALIREAMEENKGKSNAQTLFQTGKIPTDNHVRDLLDHVAPQELYPVYDEAYPALRQQGILDTFRAVHDTELIALDGTWYFSSQSENIHCKNCSCIRHNNGEVTHYQSAITPVIVALRHSLAARIHRALGWLGKTGLRNQCRQVLAGRKRRPVQHRQPDPAGRRALCASTVLPEGAAE